MRRVWGRDRGVVRSIRAAAAVGLSVVLAGTLALPAEASPTYPGKGEVSKARKDADERAGAAAVMQTKLTAAQSRLAQLDSQAEMAVEAYNGAVYELGRAKTAYTTAKKRAAQSAVEVETARKRVAGLASNAYQGAGVAQYVALLGADDPQAVMHGAGSLDALSQQQNGDLGRFRAAKVVQNVVRKQSSKALARQQAETARVKAAKQRAESKVAAQQQVIATVAALEAKLARSARTADAHADSVAADRSKGIAKARAAAARAAAEARARAAQQQADDRPKGKKPRGGGGGGGGGDPTYYGTGGKAAVKFAHAQLGKWYEWAADGPSTFDCSGLTMRAWQKGGRGLPHWSVGQYYQTDRVSLSNLRKGDLVFFANNTNNPDTIHHVGIYIGGGQMIEAPHTGAQVRISSIYRSGLIGAGRP
ncbi:MAG: hypothetical protein GEV10_21075 [Streptosporangiales bacterium]|nr:hypothetical protein [Streptosporangiales bacterium]